MNCIFHNIIHYDYLSFIHFNIIIVFLVLSVLLHVYHILLCV